MKGEIFTEIKAIHATVECLHTHTKKEEIYITFTIDHLHYISNKSIDD